MMKKQILQTVVGMIVFFFLFAIVQAQTVTLTFTGRDATNHYVQLSRVAISNLTKGWQETLIWPDTVLTMNNGTGIHEFVSNSDFGLLQNNPNPFNGSSDVNLTVVDAGIVTLEIMDIHGRIIETMQTPSLQPNIHQFRISIATMGTYVMTARQNGKRSSIKMVCNGSGDANRIEYLGSTVETVQTSLQNIPTKSPTRGLTNNPFTFGDQMEYVGYAIINGIETASQHITQALGNSQTFVLRFTGTQNQLPTVTTSNVTSITQTTAMAGGNVTSDGGSTVAAKGICWSTSRNPTISNSHTTEGSGIGSFTSRIAGLTSGTTYYVRAYATNGVGTAYGAEVSFSTLNMLPTVITSDVTNVGANTATCGGNVTSDGGATVAARGVCWSTSQNPTISDSHTTDGTGTGNFTSSITGLNGGTVYYVRAYATNNVGTAYGAEVSLTTLNSVPTVITANVTNIIDTSAVSGGNVTSDGGLPVEERGVCWSTSQNPTISDSHTSDGNGTGSFTSIITGLTERTTYYVRAYAINNMGVGYGNQLNFTTTRQEGVPCPNTPTVTDYEGNSYNTVLIGEQCWMKENLRTTKYADGTSIGQGSGTSYDVAYWYYPNNNPSNQPTHGLLYNWKAVMYNSSSSNNNPSNVQGICPTGWHIPSDAEWAQLVSYVSGESLYCCNGNTNNIGKALATTSGWNSGNVTCAVGNIPGDNNATGFSALPAGNYTGNFASFGTGTFFWGATESSTNNAYYRYMNYNNAGFNRGNFNKYFAFSVRCLRD